MFTPQFAIDLARLGSTSKADILPVGVRDLVTEDGLRVRVYYPGVATQGAEKVSWFVDSVGDSAVGYLHTMTPVHSNTLAFKVVAPALRAAANVLSL